jgi:hypothetical protein
MENPTIYAPGYKNSWALIIGINEYQHVSPLQYAVNDAEAIATSLISNFNFPEKNVRLLIDDEASRKMIIHHYLNFANDGILADDRLFVFFAGHGVTKTGKRGEIGLLVPVDGAVDELSTLIRWDSLTKNGELIEAKHILFVMDACYGGLAVTRGTHTGSMRFVNDMLMRFSRQVLAAGKANEPVSDAGGPMPGHSVFTGHFLEGLSGKAASKDGIITANGIMSYVHEKVSRDPDSQQTPHYGYIDGDGDFILSNISFDNKMSETQTENEKLVEIVNPYLNLGTQENQRELIINIKELIAEDRNRIKLHDSMIVSCRIAKSNLTDEEFPSETPSVDGEELATRLLNYERIMDDLLSTFSLLNYWGEASTHQLQEKVFSYFEESEGLKSGRKAWANLRWYPALLLLYTGGISAIAAGNYENLKNLLLVEVLDQQTPEASIPLIHRLGTATTEFARMKLFNLLPGQENQFVPLNEYLFRTRQSKLDDVIFLGSKYESLFDEFEVLYALVYADLNVQRGRSVWGPFGRFAWKHRSFHGESGPFARVITTARTELDEWAPLKVGLFGNSVDRFENVADQYLKMINQLPWH